MCFSFLRVVQTLQSLSRKTGRLLWDALPYDDGTLIPPAHNLNLSRGVGRMQSLWNSLEATLTQLRVTFLQSDSSGDEEEDGHGHKRDNEKEGERKRSAKEVADKDKEVSGRDTFYIPLGYFHISIILIQKSSKDASSAGGGSGRSQTALLSVLSRLLPAIEAFFLAHSADLLLSGGSSQSTISSVSVSSNSPGQKSDLPAPANPTVDSSSAAAASTPGLRYRQTEEYMRHNISLSQQQQQPADLTSSTDVNHPTLSAPLLRPTLSISLSRGLSILPSSSSGQGYLRSAYNLIGFVSAHRDLLNILVKNRPDLLLMGQGSEQGHVGAFAALVRVTQLRAYLSFENKRNYFFSQLKRISQQSQNQGQGRRSLNLQIRRAQVSVTKFNLTLTKQTKPNQTYVVTHQVFEDSYHQLRMRTPDEMKGRIQVNFYGEEGVDAGGLTREW